MSLRTSFATHSRRLTRSGLTEEQERIFHWLAAAVIVLMLSGWGYAIADLYRAPAGSGDASEGRPSVIESVTMRMVEGTGTPAAFLDEAVLSLQPPLQGRSGKLKAVFRQPGEKVTDRPPERQIAAEFTGESGQVFVSPAFTAPSDSGIYHVALALERMRQPLRDLSVITIVPFSRKERGRIGGYLLGTWPYENGGTPRSQRYGNPEGFIRVTPENRDTYVSEHFRIRDFLTRDQPNVWPKYLLLDPDLIDKLELVVAELESDGVEVKHMAVMSGFRTPRYNESGGNTAGRANLSRHMYGDAADIYVDNDQNGNMDDIDGNGRTDVRDAEKIGAAAERVERKYPDLVGGIGIYVASSGHGPFTHIDVRGYRARWRGMGNG